jgi:hypothetical protein
VLTGLRERMITPEIEADYTQGTNRLNRQRRSHWNPPATSLPKMGKTARVIGHAVGMTPADRAEVKQTVSLPADGTP